MRWVLFCRVLPVRVNNLSRGCSIEDVYRMIAITANQAIAAKNQNNH